MDINNLKEEEKNGNRESKVSAKSKSEKIQTQFRLVVGEDAIKALDDLVSVVNSGFTAGSVTKADLATYLFKSAHRYLKRAEIAKIRTEFFDERMALDNLIRGSESSGELPEELRKLLREQHRASLECLKSEA